MGVGLEVKAFGEASTWMMAIGAFLLFGGPAMPVQRGGVLAGRIIPPPWEERQGARGEDSEGVPGDVARRAIGMRWEYAMALARRAAGGGGQSVDNGGATVTQCPTSRKEPSIHAREHHPQAASGRPAHHLCAHGGRLARYRRR